MTNKELLYLEDAVKHLDQFQQICWNFAGEIRDKKASEQLKELGEESTGARSSLAKLVGGCENER